MIHLDGEQLPPPPLTGGPPGVSPAPLPGHDLPDPLGAQAPLSLARIQHYVWLRYVEFEPAPYELDEGAALEFLAEHYHGQALDQDSECFYWGILAYERSFGASAPDRALLRLAVRAFQAYRAQTATDFTWEPVDDRYADAVAALQDRRAD